MWYTEAVTGCPPTVLSRDNLSLLIGTQRCLCGVCTAEFAGNFGGAVVAWSAKTLKLAMYRSPSKSAAAAWSSREIHGCCHTTQRCHIYTEAG